MTSGREALTARDVARSAAPTIRGYAYQFDHAILQLLRSSGAERIRIEGVEDVDVLGGDASSAMQIKYLASARYTSPKTLREPVLEMLRSFAGGRKWRYILHVYFGSGAPPTTLSLDQLKDALTVRRSGGEIQHLYSDFEESVLQEFAGHLEVRAGQAYEAQRAQVTTELASALGCADEDARDLYYALAMTLVQGRAMARAETDRVLTRVEFLAEISIRHVVYARWHKEVVKADAYYAALVRRLRASGFGKPTRSRGIAVMVTQTSIEQAIQLGQSLARDFTGSRRLSTAKPWTVILVGEPEPVRQVKAGLIRADIRINDGYETIDFLPDALLGPPVLNVVGQSAVIAKASFGLRVVSAISVPLLAPHHPVVDSLLLAADGFTPSDSIARDAPIRVSGVEISEIRRALEAAGKTT